jgi:hypothetical protein
MNKMLTLSVLGLSALAGTAQAGLIVETESNNTPGTANFIGAYNTPGGSILIDGSITPGTAQSQTGAPGLAGDVDWFRFTVGGTATVVASIFSLNNTSADSELWLVGSNGTTILAYNDDGNPGGGSPRMSSLIQANLAPGTYFLAISGYNSATNASDGNATRLPDGYAGATQLTGHNQNFDYKFIVGFNVIPTPGAAALLGLGGLTMARRRR